MVSQRDLEDACYGPQQQGRKPQNIELGNARIPISFYREREMKYKFSVEYDTIQGWWTVVESNVPTPHSGSSYNKIRPDDFSHYGTISTHHDTYCKWDCKVKHLHFCIERNSEEWAKQMREEEGK